MNMKVAHIMHRYIISISDDSPIKEAARLIFSLGIGALPVIKGKKLVGILTGHDILSKMYPTIQDIIEDFTHAQNFEDMEDNINLLIDTPVAKVMNKKVTTVTPETPLMQAQSLMLLHRFSHLPIVNEARDLVGIISQGDIFRELIGQKMPQVEKERFARFVQQYYDTLVDWGQRFRHEYPTLTTLFKKEKVRRILDVGTWTGEYAIRLAKKANYTIVGLDDNPAMIALCEKKRAQLPAPVKKRVSFLLSDCKHLSDKIASKFDAVICMGNALVYLADSLETIIREIATVLRRNNGVLVLQLLNTEKILSQKGQLLNFALHQSDDKKQLILEFLDKKRGRGLLHQVIIFNFDGKNWILQGIKSAPFKKVTPEKLQKILIRAGFSHFVLTGATGTYGKDYGEVSLERPFDRQKSDWFTVMAKYSSFS